MHLILKRQKCLVWTGILGAITSYAFGWFGFRILLNLVVKHATRLDGGPTFDVWVEPPFPTYLKVYLFNVTNPKEIEQGGKPRLDELGPYVYRQKRTKTDFIQNQESDTIKYRQQVRQWFFPEISRGSDLDIITFVNIPLVSVVKVTHDLTDMDFVFEMLDERLVQEGNETIFKKATVRDLLWDGLDVKVYLDLMKDPRVSMFSDTIKTSIPAPFLDGKLALLEHKNGSDDSTFEVGRGIHHWETFGQIVAWNGTKELSWWKEPCNLLKGSDANGGVYPPFLSKNRTVYSFSAEVCRTLRLKYENEVTWSGVPLWSMVIDPSSFQGHVTNPSNWCFCKDDTGSCSRNGIMPLSGCMAGAPLSVSNPHFIQADSSFLTGIDGMRPKKDKHSSFFYLEPITAFTLKAAKRLQLNVDLKGWHSMAIFKNLPNVTFPVMWTEESVELSKDLVWFVRVFRNIVDFMENGKYIVVIAYLLLPVSVAFINVINGYLIYPQPQ